MCYGLLQFVAVCCSVLQWVAVESSEHTRRLFEFNLCRVQQCAAVRSSVLQFIAVWCSGLRYVAVCCKMLQRVSVCYSVFWYVAVCCSVLQYSEASTWEYSVD